MVSKWKRKRQGRIAAADLIAVLQCQAQLLYPSDNNVIWRKAFHQFLRLLQWRSREEFLKALSAQGLLLLVASQSFGVKMYKSKTLLLQIAYNFVEILIGGWTSIVKNQ